jgi:integral membrane protein (TIGR00529 family)
MDLALNIAFGIVALAFTAFCLKKDINLGLVMLADSAFVVLIARIPAGDALRFALNGIVSQSTIELVAILFLIMLLENVMRTTGMIKRIVESLKELAGGNRLAAGLLPMVIGLLPSPGGARFSCPMVDEVAQGNTDAGNKAFINFWFRHVWMDGFILYPGVILASGLLGVSVLGMFVRLLPLMLASAVMGYIFGLRKLQREKIVRTKSVRESLRSFFLSFLPILLIIAAYIILLELRMPYAMEIALGAVVLALLIIKKYTFLKFAKLVVESFPGKLLLIIAGAMVFKEILLEGGVLDGLPGLLASWGIPAVVLFVVLPFAGSVTSGITVSFVSLAFPILMPLGLGSNLWHAAATFAVGFAGNMVTPLHLCAVLTSEYYGVPLRRLLMRAALAIVPVVAVAIVILLI